MVTESYCQVAGGVKRAPAQTPRDTGERCRVAAKSAEDHEVNARIRAHLRQQMAERSIDKAELARRVGADSGNFSRMMSGERGFSAGQILRIIKALRIDAKRLLEEDPDRRWFEP